MKLIKIMKTSKREIQIRRIEKSIKQSIENNGEIIFTYDELVLAVITNLYLCKSTAKEYIDVALYKLNIDLGGNNEQRRTKSSISQFS